MAKASTNHASDLTPALNPAHETALLSTLALAALFSTTITSLSLIHPSSPNKWHKPEQLLLTALGLQQARLLIWGDIVGITSPPRSVTDRAVPRHPSAAYPDLKEPTFFGLRDGRLDEQETRAVVEEALNAIVDRAGSGSGNKEEMMERFGLKPKPPQKRFSGGGDEVQQALDTNRLEALKEKYELLREVAETYARLELTRAVGSGSGQNSWVIADTTRFGAFVELVRERVDGLIQLMGCKEGIDRGMRMDIRGLGWHLSADRARVAQDTSKLRLIAECCQGVYPEYVDATRQALENIGREAMESRQGNPWAASDAAASATTATAEKAKLNPSTAALRANGVAGEGKEQKRPGVLGGLFRSFRKNGKDPASNKGRSQSVAVPGTNASSNDPLRSQSDSGPTTRSGSLAPQTAEADEADSDTQHLEPLRSKSVGDIQDLDFNEEVLEHYRLARLGTQATVKDEELAHSEAVDLAVSRHDQYRGIARTETRDLRQG